MILHPATLWLSPIFFGTIATMEAVTAGIAVLLAVMIGIARRQKAASATDVDMSLVHLAEPTTLECSSRELASNACEQNQLCWRRGSGKRKRRSTFFGLCHSEQIRKAGKQIIKIMDVVGDMFASSQPGLTKKEGMKLELMAAASHGDL